MKKKLLTVLLAVVMVFGVFGLTACKGSNKDEDYNYYGIKYELEDEVKIEAVTFQGVYKMFTTPGRFLLYIDSETSSTVKADFQAINKLANDWNVTIYHFNPDLTGGYAKTATTANANVIKETDADTNNLKTIRSELLKVSGQKDLSKWTDSSLMGIIGADSTVSGSSLKYNGKITSTEPVSKAVDAIVAVLQSTSYQSHAAQKPSYGAYTEDVKDIPKVPEAYMTDEISTMNLFGDARLHMYNDDNGVDALTDAKEDVYVTVANYAMFAHLMDYNEGYFPVFFGGTWCPNTQAIAKATNQIAKDYGIEKIYFFDPRLADGTRTDDVTSTKSFSEEKYAEDMQKAELAYAKAELAAEKAVADAKAALKDAQDALDVAEGGTLAALQAAATKAAEAYQDAVKAAEKALAEANDNVVYATIAQEELLAGKPSDAQKAAAEKAIKDAQATVTSVETANTNSVDAAKKVADEADAAVLAFQAAQAAFDTAYEAWAGRFENPDYDYCAGKVLASYEEILAEAKKGTNKDAIAAAQADVDNVKAIIADAAALEAAEATVKEAQEKADAAEDAEPVAKAAAQAALMAAAEAAGYTTEYSVVENSGSSVYGFNTRDNDYACEWAYAYASFLDNYLDTYQSEWNITAKLTIGGKDYTRMCVPNMMLFNGEEEGKAELVALAEAEFRYEQVNEEGSPSNVAWSDAIKAIFDEHPYAVYNPVVVVEEAPAADAGSSSAGSSAGAAAGGAAEAC